MPIGERQERGTAVTKIENGRLFIAALIAILLAIPAFAQVEQDPLSGLDSYIEMAMERWEVPGVSVAIVKDQEVVYAKGFGVRNLEEGGEVDADTLFAIGSCTKAFTTTAIGLLVEEGRISWDDPVLRYMPDFQMYDPVVTREITIRDLLCHRSGLGTFEGDLTWFGSVYDRAEAIYRTRFLEPVFDFRTGFGYSNLMFLVAGEIIPRVTETSWDDFVDQRLFSPLGMDRSNTSVVDLEAMGNVAAPHTRVAGEIAPIAHDDIDNMAPAGAINSSANDMARWLLLQTGDGVFGGKQIVDSAVIDETRTPHNLQQVSNRAKELNPWTHFSAYGLGWGLSDYRGRLVVAHGGGLPGMVSSVAILPEENLGVVVLTNFDLHGLRQSVVNHVIDAYLGADPVDWDDRYFEIVQNILEAREQAKTARDETRVEGTTPSHSLEDYAGRFTNAVYGEAVITLEDGVLVLDPKAHPAVSGRLEHWQFDTFLCTWTDSFWDQSLVYFELDEAGEVSQFRFTVRPDVLDTLEYVFVRQSETR
jgi:CubicO group peptidase (beta-lactamase class C family)